ncbi:MAG: DUF5106 domain-containing protein [Bacteroidales bacterium]|nr:DUF5106 domain-containing protein [Bacteroidales bacterium]
MKKRCYISVLLGVFLWGMPLFAQKKASRKVASPYNYEVTIVLEGVPDTMLFVGYYYADKTYSKDSIFVEKRKPYTYVLHGKDTLHRGVYIVAGQRHNKYLEFIVDSSMFFTIRATGLTPPYYDVLDHLSFENSPENDVFLHFQKTMVRYQVKAAELSKAIKQESAKEAPNQTLLDTLKAERSRNYDSMHLFTDWQIETYPNQLFSKLQKMGLEVEVPPLPEGRDSVWLLWYYISHYWDNTDLTDDGMIFSPMFHPFLKHYYEQVAPTAVDSLIKYTDLLIEKTTSKELFKYIVWYVTHKYERSKYVGQDAVFVHMVKKYYEQGLCPWVDSTTLEAMVERADKLDPILVGRQAPHLMMMDLSKRLRSSYEFDKKYTIMWFWDVDCSHCKSATPKLVEFYNRLKDSLDLEVFAVCMSADTVAWRKYVNDHNLPWVNVGGNVANIDFVQVYDVHSTPQIYVLDKQKKIIVKKISVDELENFMRRYDKGEIRY